MTNLRHIIASQQFDINFLHTIFNSANSMIGYRGHDLNHQIMASLFYEPSTRTRMSFESAMIRLGGVVITTENARQFSSAAKGESLEDTIKIIGTYVDVIVLRHDHTGAGDRASSVSSVPIINAGDGAGQHPTQALLDLYTIWREFGILDGLRVAFVGDLKHGRTVRSLIYLLGKYKNIEIVLVSPPDLVLGSDIKEYMDRHAMKYSESNDLESIIGTVNVVYQTRIQKERFQNIEDYEKNKGHFIIDRAIAGSMSEKSIILHPLPRVGELARDVDDSPHARYFEQAANGLPLRMALLKYVFDK
jgi:aspartate carbamoyltransferase catalytic subunit